MKKIFTLLFAFTALITASVFAQLPCNAEFNFTVGANGYVQFLPINGLAVAHSWSFGDGASSYEASPVHSYSAGTYNVVHVVSYWSPNDSTIQCTDSAIRAVTIVGQPACNIDAAFTFGRDSVQTNKVYFTNLSSGTNANTVSFWNFGDGSISYDNNPVHVFPASGAYTVCLTVMRDSACNDVSCSVVQVQAPLCNLTVNFSAFPDSLNPSTIYFENLSGPIAAGDTVRWFFGDGATSTSINTQHTYANPGTYNVCQVVKKMSNGAVVCTREFCRQVVIAAPCNIQPNFVYFPDSSIATPFIYNFINTTASLNNADSSFWNFGDGSPVVINPANPVQHTYFVPGAYTVCLRIKKVQPGTINVICERSICQTIVIQGVQCNLQAYFTAAADSTNFNLLYFQNLSGGFTTTDSARWTFGDGSSSTAVNPAHTYTAPGTYQVCLRVSRTQLPGTPACVDEYCRSITIQPSNTCNLTVNFIDSAFSNNTFHFINQSTPLAAGDSIRWTFGDGTSSADINPTHTYNQPGTYNVCLRVKKAASNTTTACVREICHTVVVQSVNNCTLVADFSYFSDSVNAGPGNIYHFANTSTPLTGIDSSFWNFGDGSPVVINPPAPVTHTYSAPGNYVVCLVVKKVIPGTTTIWCEQRVCKSITVTVPNPCDQLQVNFSWMTDSSNSRKIRFINQTNPLTANVMMNWSFGDGTSGTALNPDHIYAQPGTYMVCLRAQMANCIKDTCKVVVVQGSPIDSCNTRPSFTYRQDQQNRRKLIFTNTSVTSSATATATWSFGDGTSSSGWNADHVYAIPGYYLVCLTVRQGNSCTRTACDSVFVPGNVIPPLTCDSFRLEYGYRRDNYMPNKLFFFAAGNAPVYNQRWSFTRLGDSNSVIVNQNNPVYVFPDTGWYRVCVKGRFSTNCTKEYCSDIRITSTNVPSQCVLNAYPNPARNHVSFNVQLNQAGVITSTVLSMQGVVLMQYTQTGVAGNNPVTLNIHNLCPGFYTVRITYNGRVCYTRFQKF